LPVFANHSGGIDKLLGHTSGFLWGFVVIGTGLSWTNRRRAMGFPPLLLAALSAHLLLLIPGFTVLYWHLPDAALTSIFLNLFPGLLIKTLIIAVLVNAKQRRSESPVEIAN
jgi:biotin transporter BioY